MSYNVSPPSSPPSLRRTNKVLLIYTGGTIGMGQNPVTKALEPLDFNHLVESPVIDKLVAETFKIYVAEYSSPGMRLGTPERKELKKWLAAQVFHIIEDELDGLTPEEIKEFENNPYYSSGDFDKTVQ